MRHVRRTAAVVLALALLGAGCQDTPSVTEPPSDALEARADLSSRVPDGPHEIAAPVFDIDAGPSGNILFAETAAPDPRPDEGEFTTVVKEIQPDGIREVAEITHRAGSPINGLASVGQGDFFATNGGLDLAEAAGVRRVSRGNARLVADIETFAHANSVDATEGPEWKAEACEESPEQGFAAGPHSNPYHLTTLSGGAVLVGDAAGNTVLSATTNGAIDWVALLTPPTAEGDASDDPDDWIVLFTLPDGTDCYVQPVPTSVAIGPDGDYWVGELTGVTPTDIGLEEDGPTTGLSRVWRIESGATNVVCPSEECELALTGFTSIIDIAFGADDRLHVVEYDEAGWFTAVELGSPTSGTIHACDTVTDEERGDCDAVEAGLDLPAAITFDKWGDLWVLENNLGFPFLGAGVPTVRRVDTE